MRGCQEKEMEWQLHCFYVVLDVWSMDYRIRVPGLPSNAIYDLIMECGSTVVCVGDYDSSFLLFLFSCD